jgi:hypothetical protein
MNNTSELIDYYLKNGFTKTIKEYKVTKYALYKLLNDNKIEKYNLKKTIKNNLDWYDSLPANEEEYHKYWKNYKKDTSWLDKYVKYDLNEID